LNQFYKNIIDLTSNYFLREDWGTNDFCKLLGEFIEGFDLMILCVNDDLHHWNDESWWNFIYAVLVFE